MQSNCSLYRVTTKEELDSFSCGDEDLDDFFHQEACLYDGQLLGKTYFFATERSGKDEIVCAFTLANDSIKNGFKFLYSTEELEKEANHIPEDEHLESRMMYLDLLGYIR